MKVWEYCRDMYLEHISKLEAVGGRCYNKEFDWKRFAKTGNCDGLACSMCPLKGYGCKVSMEGRASQLCRDMSELGGKYIGAEVTKWDGRPRTMWVWDVDRANARKRLVVHISRFAGKCDTKFPVICVDDKDDNEVCRFAHCAELTQEPDTRRRMMTNRELSRWLRERPDREWCRNGTVYCDSTYLESRQDEPVGNDVRVREGDGPWYVPFAEEGA